VDLSSKRATLDGRLRSLGRLLVAYSGGVDSAFLAWAAIAAFRLVVSWVNWTAKLVTSASWRLPNCVWSET
jgi:PP-loop superfamily ATP-utilizing enzyme